MKKNKIIGSLIAIIGMGASVGAAFALYTKAATNASFTVGKYTHTETSDNITYVVSSDDDVSGALNPSSGVFGDGITLTFALSGQYGSNLKAQDYIYGNVKVEYTIAEGLTAESAVYMADYDPNTYGKTQYGSTNINNNGSGNTAVSTGTSFNRDVAVETAGVQSVKVFLKISGMTADKMIQFAESQAYSVSVTFGAPSVAIDKFVTGDGSEWGAWDEYRMVPNIKAASEEYMFKGLTGFTQAKARNSDGSVWSSGDNKVLNPASAYTIYWNGSGSSSISTDPAV